MGKCPSCGNKLSNLDVLCPRCGALVEVVQNKNNIQTDSGNISSNIKPPNYDLPPDKIIPDSPAEITSDKLNDFSFVTNDNHEKIIGDSKPFFNSDDNKEIEVDKKTTQPVETSAKDKKQINAYVPSQEGTNEGAFSLGYIHSIKSMPLTELDNLDDFDPEDFIRQYRQKNRKDASADITQAGITEKNNNNLDNLPNSLWFDEAVNQNDKAENKQASLVADETQSPLAAGEAQTPLALNETRSSLALEETQKKENEDIIESEKKLKREQKENGRIAKAAKAAKKNKAPHVVGKIPVYLTVIIWVLVAGMLFAGSFFLDSYVKATYGGYGSFIYKITDGKIDIDTSKVLFQNDINVSVTQTRDNDGAYAHIFEVTAKNGVSVNIMPLNETLDLRQGHARITIGDFELARSLDLITYENRFITSDIFFEVTSRQSSYKYNIDNLELFLITPKYERQQPSGSATTIVEDSFNVNILVEPDTKVYINKEDYSSFVDKGGVLNTNISLEKLGEETFIIDITSPGRASVKDTFTVTWQEPRTTLIPDSNYMRLYFNAFECLGSTDPDATVTAKINDMNYVAEISDEGRYSILCYLDTFGLHHAQLTAASPYKADNTIALTIEYLPEVNSFMSEARKSAINEIDNKSLQDLPLSVKGNLKNILTEDEVQNFVLYAQDDEIDCYYYGPIQLTQDREYTLYGVYDIDTSSFYVMYAS